MVGSSAFWPWGMLSSLALRHIGVHLWIWCLPVGGNASNLYQVPLVLTYLSHTFVSLPVVMLLPVVCISISIACFFHVLVWSHCKFFSYVLGFLFSGLTYAWTLDYVGVQTVSRRILLWAIPPSDSFHLVLCNDS